MKKPLTFERPEMEVGLVETDDTRLYVRVGMTTESAARALLTADQEQQIRRALVIRKFIKFFPIARAAASLSKDPSTKVGALALDDRRNVIALAYNGFPRGVVDSDDRYLDRETKLKLVSHAEQNLVAQSAYCGRSLAGATVLLTSLYPCSSCAKSLIQAGIARVITVHPDSNPRWADEAKWSKILFAESSVEVIHVKEIIGPDGTSVWEADGT